MEPTDEQVQAVYSTWRALRPNPQLVVLTPARASAIRARLREGHTMAQLVALVVYAHQGDSNEARWWRGDNPEGREYMDLVNLLRATKTAARVERAWAWFYELAGAPQPGSAQYEADGDVPDANLGPMAAFRGTHPTTQPARLPPARSGQPVIGRVPKRS